MINNNTYIGITIGPIYNTIRLSSTPAAMWLSSYMFSHISYRICEKIADKLSKDALISPNYDCENVAKLKNGIGLFHDRIIFETTDQAHDMELIKTIFTDVKYEIAQLFGSQYKDWFAQYLQFHAVAFEAEDGTPILESAQFLDAIECEKTFPVITEKNPFLTVFEADNKNKLIHDKAKEAFKLEEWPFIPSENGSMADMKEIVGKVKESKRNGPKARKAYSYYAVVQSDGDSFGEYIKKKEKDGKSKCFSKQCLNFCSTASDLIQNYGGVTIYAGGDDLLFLAPLWENPNSPTQSGKNLINLLIDLKTAFQKEFAEGKDAPPTISFGVAIRFYKYPLYEAFDEAYDMLSHHAKSGEKNSIALSLQKHSGQTVQFVMENFSKKCGPECDIECGKEASIVPAKLSEMITAKTNGDFLKSVSTKIWQFQSLFELALSKKSSSILQNIFDNTFDSDIHKKYKSELDETKELLTDLTEKKSHVREIGKKHCKKSDPLYSLDALLRFVKFFTETVDEEEKNNAD